MLAGSSASSSSGAARRPSGAASRTPQGGGDRPGRPPPGAATRRPSAERSAGGDLITLLGGSENRLAEELSRAVKRCLSRGLRRSHQPPFPLSGPKEKKEKGAPPGFLRPQRQVGRQPGPPLALERLPALDAGLLCSPAGTNPPGREQRGASSGPPSGPIEGTALRSA